MQMKTNLQLSSLWECQISQELDRHTNIAVRQRYTLLSDDELDKGYWNAIEDK